MMLYVYLLIVHFGGNSLELYQLGCGICLLLLRLLLHVQRKL